MDRQEVDRRFMALEPIEGVAFLLNDSVEITAGPYRGGTGDVIALREVTPEPIYVVELATGQNVELRQTDLVGASAADALAELQRWYSAQCDGDWEHTYGIKIDTLDNPGWSVSIDLTDTALADAAFPEVSDLDPEREWIHCRVQDGRFQGHGGPHMLGQILRTFLRWSESVSKRAA